jgi:DNA ligase D-like protein (predicted 3'-phosphoesterase)
VLASWAVPSIDSRDKRLAMRTEDHPPDYYDFEGNIPESEYGAGSVIVWDAGTFENQTQEGGEEIPLSDAIDNGHVTVWLRGQKVHGGYSLRRTSGGEREKWLLVKKRDEEADGRRNPVRTQPESILTGRTNEDVAREG